MSNLLVTDLTPSETRDLGLVIDESERIGSAIHEVLRRNLSGKDAAAGFVALSAFVVLVCQSSNVSVEYFHRVLHFCWQAAQPQPPTEEACRGQA